MIVHLFVSLMLHCTAATAPPSGAGVVAAKLDARSVTVTDLTAQLLRNLRETVVRNFRPPRPASPSSIPPSPTHPDATRATPATTQAAQSQLLDLEFSDAESVSDEAELFAGDCSSDGAGGDTGAGAADEDAIGWDSGPVSVRVMDWKVEWDAWAAERGVSAWEGDSVTECAPGLSPCSCWLCEVCRSGVSHCLGCLAYCA